MAPSSGGSAIARGGQPALLPPLARFLEGGRVVGLESARVSVPRWDGAGGMQGPVVERQSECEG